ncbi:PIG-L deacetylase family protein [Paenibacillus macerans]|uniref:GlcNAc-PI de-N-acetylase family protein n=1 Tax=Paenibacillus macerans TaxID=44252 RepID=A0A090ZIX1_PAEMA|nr:PIG-L deacetylase family protein [Paenibacillus macerans]KFN11299.1 glcNAc-PI de-N-acetylase family protein [Paenibacillus macerans]MCY7560213.1 PIG-L family deacetylase [Paenibacillus macerans]MEC0151267.1 PIG-L family deacetylase [Paenibacillus macerans]
MNKLVLAIMAHPDDAELRCFGTLRKYQDKGYICKVIIVCAGENGISLIDKEKQEINSLDNGIRLKETREAFKKSNIEVVNLDFTDGYLVLNNKLISSIEHQIRILEPEIIITHFPDAYGVDHQDHNVVGKAVINSASRIKTVNTILLCEPLQVFRSGFIPNFFVEITDYFNSKIEALKYHETQKGRFYLESEFHDIRSRYYACSVGYDFAKSDKKVEVFQLIYNFVE